MSIIFQLANTEEISMGQTIKIGALVSGGGTNLQAIMDSCNSGHINGKIVFVGSDNSNSRGLERGRRKKIPTFVVDYGSIIKEYKENSDQVRIPDDFDLEDIQSKQTLFPDDADVEKVKTFLITRAVAEAKILEKIYIIQLYSFKMERF